MGQRDGRVGFKVDSASRSTAVVLFCKGKAGSFRHWVAVRDPIRDSLKAAMGTVRRQPPEQLVFRELDSGVVAWRVFFRKFGHPPPLDGHHVCAFLRDENHLEHLICYIHFRPHGEILLGGGAATNTSRLRRMRYQTRDMIRAKGGLYRMCLAWSLENFSKRYKAVFGFCGDRLAERVDRAVGFSDTGYEHLLVFWLDDCDAVERTRLIAQAHAFGPF